ncbi:uncharacterized protein LOC121862710 isoform X1 [Homarus americanus]|uniref:uncharacterized protein LOC121862710 isoform X1 n=1 Tax=Homarus americanus TaxID=6706 RepID=UPI001C46DC0B|nr:uncharacterized protein LOC121862710 isoform X1 [Homarus americanus]XP_042216958.1 uncharacterized protein LOC121862710 isoform X1 [Homarus americanus]XP_042216959.1 uncharacterized protein LOC121862710 isoform X1 [Homarus americanus]
MWKDVFGNILYFMHDLLPAATSKTNWTQDGIDRAVSWGAYCERAARKFFHNGSMELALSQLAKQSPWVLTVHDLKNARQLLLRLLVQNQLLKPDVKEHVHYVVYKVLGSDEAAILHKQASQQQKFFKKLNNTLRQNKDLKRRLQTRLMLEAANSSGQGELQDCLSKMVVLPRGLSQILEAAKLDNAAGSINQNICLGPQIINWFEGVLLSPLDNNHRRLVRSLCTEPSSVLSELLIENPSFLKSVLSTLNREIQKLEPHFSGEGCCWMPQSPSVSILSYQDVVNVCMALLKNKVLAVCIQEMVCHWCSQDGGAAWIDVLKDANVKKQQDEQQHNDQPGSEKDVVGAAVVH